MQAGPLGASLLASTKMGAEQQVDRQLRSRSKRAAMSLHINCLSEQELGLGLQTMIGMAQGPKTAAGLSYPGNSPAVLGLRLAGFKHC